MNEHRIVWFFAAVAMAALGIVYLTDDGVFLGALFLAGAMLCAAAGFTNRDYTGRKPPT